MTIAETLAALKASVGELHSLDDGGFDRVISLWHQVNDELKDAVFDRRNKDARINFEEGWGAQSIQFVIDCIPEVHRVLKTHYRRRDCLSFLDVGAGSGAGSNIFAMLHSGRHVYSKLQVDAVDHANTRRRWVKTMYPRVNYKVADVFDLPSRNWDIVFCSHVIEHVRNPRPFLEKLADLSKGFLFVYSPYKEVDRIPGHLNTITESLYDGLKIEKMTVMKSMAWHADIAQDLCLLAVIDCRQ